jgi:hypothetical protein
MPATKYEMEVDWMQRQPAALLETVSNHRRAEKNATGEKKVRTSDGSAAILQEHTSQLLSEWNILRFVFLGLQSVDSTHHAEVDAAGRVRLVGLPVVNVVAIHVKPTHLTKTKKNTKNQTSQI